MTYLQRIQKARNDAKQLTDLTPRRKGPALGIPHDPNKRYLKLVKRIQEMKY